MFIMHSLAGPIVVLASVFSGQAAFHSSRLSDLKAHAMDEVSSATNAPARKSSPVEALPSDSAQPHQAKRICLDLNASPEQEWDSNDQLEPLTLHGQNSSPSTIEEGTSRASANGLKTARIPNVATESLIQPVRQPHSREQTRNGLDLNLSPNRNSYTNELLERNDFPHSQASDQLGNFSPSPNRLFCFSTSLDDNSRPSLINLPSARAGKRVKYDASSNKGKRVSSLREESSSVSQKRKSRARFRDSQKRSFTLTPPDSSVLLTPAGSQLAHAARKHVNLATPPNLNQQLFNKKTQSCLRSPSFSFRDKKKDRPSGSQGGAAHPLSVTMVPASSTVDIITLRGNLDDQMIILENSNSTPKLVTKGADTKDAFPAAENLSPTDSDSNQNLKKADLIDTELMSHKNIDLESMSDTGNDEIQNNAVQEITTGKSSKVMKSEESSDLQVGVWFKQQMKEYSLATSDKKPKMLKEIIKVAFAITPVIPRSEGKTRKNSRSNFPLSTPLEILRNHLHHRQKSSVYWYCERLKPLLVQYYHDGFGKHLKQVLSMPYNLRSELNREVLIIEGIKVLESIQGHEKLSKVLLEAKINSLPHSYIGIHKLDILEGNKDFEGIQSQIPPDEYRAETSRTLSISELRETIYNKFYTLPTKVSCAFDSTILYFSYLSHMHEFLNDGTTKYAEKIHNSQQIGVNFLMNFWKNFFRIADQSDFKSENFLKPSVKSAMISLEEKMEKRNHQNVNNLWALTLLKMTISQDMELRNELRDFSSFFFEDDKMGTKAFLKFVLNQAISNILVKDVSN